MQEMKKGKARNDDGRQDGENHDILADLLNLNESALEAALL